MLSEHEQELIARCASGDVTAARGAWAAAMKGTFLNIGPENLSDIMTRIAANRDKPRSFWVAKLKALVDEYVKNEEYTATDLAAAVFGITLGGLILGDEATA